MPKTPTRKVDRLLQLAAKGPLRARDLAEAGIPRTYLERLVNRGLLYRSERGVYRLVDAPVSELATLADVAKRVPHAVVCLLSALRVHGMTSESPHAVWLLLDRHARTPKLVATKVEVVRASGLARLHGIETRVVEGVDVRVTTPAKTVADCFRFRRHVGLDVAIAALDDYFKARKGSVDALVEAARADRIYAFMRPYIEVLT